MGVNQITPAESAGQAAGQALTLVQPEGPSRRDEASSAIHTGRTIEDLVEQVSRRVDALSRVLAKQEQRRAEIQKEIGE